MSKPHRSNTLDRLQRFSFGGSRSNSKDRDRKKDETETASGSRRSVTTTRSNSEKTERLRELTEKLKGLSPQVRSPIPKRPNRRLPPTTTPKLDKTEPCEEPDETSKSVQSSDFIHRKFPFKSVSFSQVDFSPIDGKYTRRKSASSCLNLESSDNKSDEATKSGDSTTTEELNDIPSVVAEITKNTTFESSINEEAPAHENESARDNVDSGESTNLESRTRNMSIDKSKKRKGVYITKWPTSIETSQDILGETMADGIPTFYLQEDVAGSPTANSSCWSSPQEESSYTPEEWYGNAVNGPEWPNPGEPISGDTKPVPPLSLNHLLVRVDSLSESESEHRDCLASSRPSIYSDKSDISDCESQSTNPSQVPRRYSKRPLRGPYGLMLEAEMKKPETSKMFSKLYYNKEFQFLDDIMVNINNNNNSLNNNNNGSSNNNIFNNNSEKNECGKSATGYSVPVRTRSAGNRSLDETHLKENASVRTKTPPILMPFPSDNATPGVAGQASVLFTRHQRTTSSPSKLEGIVATPGKDVAAIPDLSEASLAYLCHLPADNNEGHGGGDGGDEEPSGHALEASANERQMASDAKLLSESSQWDEASEPGDEPRKLHEQLKFSEIPSPVNKSSVEISTDSVCRSNSNMLDTRTHVVVELYDTERSYVESLQILVTKYLEPLKSPECVGLLEPCVVDEIFDQVPALLSHHELFLEELRKRLEHWDVKQKIGDIFIDVFIKPAVVDTYTTFVNNWKKAKELIKSTAQAKPAFAKFLESMARENKGKFALDSLLIKPIQKFPKYEMLIQRLLKHTDVAHPDHQLLLEAQHQIHELLLKINCTERESTEFEQQQQNLKELECLVEGLMNLVVSDRQYLRHDLVTMITAQGTRKDRALFLFSDLLVITSIKRRSGTVKKPSTICPASVTNSLETHKYKLLMRLPLDDLEIIKPKDDSVRRMMNEIENISEDLTVLNQINHLIGSLHCPHEQLEDIVRDMVSATNRQLTERQNSGSQISYLELSLNTANGIEIISILFPKNENRTSWEDCFNEAKQKLALSPNRRSLPEFMSAVPIRKTRSGLQFTCAAPTLTTTALSAGGIPGSSGGNSVRRDTQCQNVWVCNSDGYVGQVCVLSLYPEPTVVSCNSVCNARILCMASIPAFDTNSSQKSKSAHASAHNMSYTNCKMRYGFSMRDSSEQGSDSKMHLDSSSSSESENDEVDVDESSFNSAPPTGDSHDFSENAQPTMWLGTEDGCIHMYNSSDNIRIKKNKIKIQHSASVQCIIYLDNRVFVSLANGDVTIYTRDSLGVWNTIEPCIISVGTASMPVVRMLPNSGKLWCGCPNTIKILNITTLQVEHSFVLSNDSSKQLACMTLSGLGVWLSMHNSAVVKCYHAVSYELLCEVNVTPTVNKMLSSCDDIIRQHKAACLRVTALLASKELLWIGTSAGVLLTLLIPHVTPTTDRITSQLNVTGLSHGHTGQVRFLTFVEDAFNMNKLVQKGLHHKYANQNSKDQNRVLIISGGDGYEDFRNASVSEMAGREDSTNHLLLWHL